jgi:hypothetical protein
MNISEERVNKVAFDMGLDNPIGNNYRKLIEIFVADGIIERNRSDPHPFYKDYESIRQELLAKVPQLTDRWTDFNPSDLGVVLLELFCGVGDMLSYYLDAQAAGSRYFCR